MKRANVQKKEATKKATAKRRVAMALAKYLQKVNPGRKIIGVGQQKLKGGVIKVRPIFAGRKGNPAKETGPFYVVTTKGDRHGPFETRKEADAYAGYLRKTHNIKAWVRGRGW